MSKYVYLLFQYDEYGPDEMIATLDRSKIIELAKAQDKDGKWFRPEDNVIGKLEEILKQNDEALSNEKHSHDLMSGWGGLSFKVLKVC